MTNTTERLDAIEKRLQRIEERVFPKPDERTEEELLAKVKEVIKRHQDLTATMIQRKLKIGYAKSARLRDVLEDEGYLQESA